MRRTLQAETSPEVPATFLREHPDAVLWIDEPAAALL